MTSESPIVIDATSEAPAARRSSITIPADEPIDLVLTKVAQAAPPNSDLIMNVNISNMEEIGGLVRQISSIYPSSTLSFQPSSTPEPTPPGEPPVLPPLPKDEISIQVDAVLAVLDKSIEPDSTTKYNDFH